MTKWANPQTHAALELASVIGALNESWRPHTAQQLILNAIFRDGKLVVMLECGRKFGKSELDCYFLWRLALTTPGEYYFFIPQQNQVREVVWANGRLQNFGPQNYIDKINEQEMRIRMINGSFIKCDGSDNFDKYRGPNPKGAVYDEFRDFRAEFHPAFGPNLSTHKAPLLVNGSPPEINIEHYEALKKQAKKNPRMAFFNYPSWANPHGPDREWLTDEKETLFERGEEDVWYREYGAKKVRGGKKSIFPMFDAPTDEQPHTSMVWPHAKVIAEIERDRKKLIWQVICDPGNSSVFAVLFRAINPYTRKVYRLDEIYEKDQKNTSTSRIVPRIQEMREELYPNWEAYGIEWEMIYDEAATWFYTEAENSFDETFLPTQKAQKDIGTGLSLIKDQMLHGLWISSDRCENLGIEIGEFIKDQKTNKPNAKCPDHLIDCDRYGNDGTEIDLRPQPEPEGIDPDLQPRFKTIEQDAEQGDFDDDFGDVEGF